MNRSIGSEWVRFKPPRPASRNLRPTDGMASNISTWMPALAMTSAAIRPAGPPPMTAALGAASRDLSSVGNAVMSPPEAQNRPPDGLKKAVKDADRQHRVKRQ